jgi:site-specific DNA-methyltransferase (adenine-specific)
MNYEIKQGDCLEVLKTLPSESVNCCITSPPYWGLRDYGTGEWIGGDPNCSHKRDSKQSELTQTGHRNLEGAVGEGIYKDKCKRCGAERKDRQIGLELTPDNYVQKMVDVFREVRRVLRGDGTLWLNLGDSYSKNESNNGGYSSKSTLSGFTSPNTKGRVSCDSGVRHKIDSGLKPKDLCGIPWRVALALQADGWYLRQDIIWHKPNPMPESVTDRCTKAHEYIFLMTKSANYHFDNEAIKEDSVWDVDGTGTIKRAERQREGLKSNPTEMKNGIRIKYPNGKHGDGQQSPKTIYGKRNKRSVWSVNVKPYKEAHFATFPKELIEPCVLAGCPKDGTILDPFGGSGTTAEVAIENGRNALLIELNPEYIELAKTRISNTQSKLFC